jgi:hypothetical protein
LNASTAIRCRDFQHVPWDMAHRFDRRRQLQEGRVLEKIDHPERDPAKVTLRADAVQVPAVLVPGLRPISIKGIQAALRAARTLP